MRMLVVAPQPFFSPRGTPFSVYYRTLVTCSLGHEVDLLTYGQGSDVEIPGCRIVRTPGLGWLGPIPVGPSYRKSVHDALLILWTIGLLLRRRYPVVHAHEEAVFWCRWLRPFFRFRLIYDMHSSLPQQLHNFEFTRLRLVHWAFEKLERSAVRAAEAVIVVCPALADYARALTPDHDKIALIENSLFEPVKLAGTDFGESIGPQHTADPRSVEDWLRSRQSEGVITYAGTLEAYQGIDRLIEAFALVVQRLPEAGLLVVGGMPREVEHYRSLVDSYGLGSAVHFTGQVSPLEAQCLVGRGVASISVRLTGNNTPMKIYRLMGAGIPLIATRVESHTQVLIDDIAILAEPTPRALSDAMVSALCDPEGARAKAEKARQWYEEHYARGVYTAKVRKLLERVD